MEILYRIEDKEVLKEKPLNDGSKIILARWIRKELGNKIQFVTWLLNPETNITFCGNYYDTLPEAADNFSKRKA